MSQIDALINLCYPSQIFPLQSLYNGRKLKMLLWIFQDILMYFNKTLNTKQLIKYVSVQDSKIDHFA